MIRNLLRVESPQGIAQLAENASLSYPTVAGLLKELVNRGEVSQTSDTESCGGRPGIRFELNASYQYALILYFKDRTLQAVIYNASGHQVEKDQMEADEDITISRIVRFVKTIKVRYEAISAIAFGVPGVVHEREITYLPAFPKLEGKELYRRLSYELNVDVFLENDLNAVALTEIGKWSDFAHIAYVNGCIGTGIVMNGEVMKGSHGNAGELEYLCEDMSRPAEALASCILALVCVLDVPDVLISGNECTEQTVKDVETILMKKIPKQRIPQITMVGKINELYEYGLWKRILIRWSETEQAE